MRYLLLLAFLALPIVVMAQRPSMAPPVKEVIQESIGEQLFNDPILSVNGEISCTTCHPKDHSFASRGLPFSLVGGTLARKAPSLLNRSQGKSFFWDGRASSLEEQVIGPLTNPAEMGRQSIQDVLDRLQIKYPMIDSEEKLTKAIADYERTLSSPPNRLDRYTKGEETLEVSEVRGWNLFRGKAECYLCHSPKTNFTDEKYHNTGIGIGQRKDGSQYTYDRGRFDVTGVDEEMCAYKTPGLKGCKDSGPYMHNASIQTLEEVVEFYDAGGFPNRYLDKGIRPLHLNRQEKADLVLFLKSL